MNHASTTTRPRRLWRRVAILVACLVAAAGGAVATYPMWADSLVQAMVKTRLERIAGVPVRVDSLDIVDYDSVALAGVELAIDAETSVELSRVDVALDRHALWSGQVVIVRVDVRGGELRGDVATWRRYALDLRSRLAARRGDGEGRVKIVPSYARAEGLEVSLRGELGERALRLGTTLSAEGQPFERAAGLELRGLELTLGERTLRATRIATDLKMSRGAERSLEFPLRVEVEGAATALTPKIAVADIRGTFTVADAAASRLALDLVGGFSDEVRRDADEAADAPLWALSGEFARDFADGTVELTMESFKLGRIPEVLAQLPVVESEGATVGGDLKVAFAEGVAQLEGDLELAGLNVDHPLLARQPVRGLGFAFDFSANVDPARRTVKVDAATLQRGAVKLELDGEFVHAEARDQRRYRARLAMPKVRCQEFLAAIPAELIPSLQGFELKGDFELELAANIDFSDFEALALEAKLNPSTCKPTKVPPLVSATRLNGPFVHRVVMRDGSERTVDVSEGSGSFTALDQISPHVVAAVMTTEDGGFWRHRGFITSQFKAALRRNLEAGQVRLGASTISMQMVKNVLLSHERTLSRKLQELFLTWYIEQSLTKQRIMELYLNVIEFGPGVYGITRAASHYFGKAPLDLTPPEAAYLALMLPSPVRRHVHYCEQELTPAFQAKLKRLLGIMHGRGRLDDEAFELWKEEGVIFDATDLTSKKECLAEIQRLLAASEQQRSLSGLLEDGAELDEFPIDAEPAPEPTAARAAKRRDKPEFDDPALGVIGGDE